MKSTEISIVMCAYNEKPEFLKASIDSMLNQTYNEFEFIITLDNPNNSTLEAMIREYKRVDDRIIFIKNEVNLGLSKSLNNAIDLATGKYIVRMDADDISSSDRIDTQYKYMIKHNVDIVGSGLIKIDENGDVLKHYQASNYCPKQVKRILPYVDIIYHPTWMVKRKTYIELGKYKDIHACEDYDLLLRALKKNMKIHYIDMPLVWYRMTSNSISRSNRLKQYLTSRYVQQIYRGKKGYSYNNLPLYLEMHNTNANQEKFSQLEHLGKLLRNQIVRRKYFAFTKKFLFETTRNKYLLNLVINEIRFRIIGYQKP